ncbi:MAG TPA: serine/threonine protein kinase [Acidimicrobiia bacterium]
MGLIEVDRVAGPVASLVYPWVEGKVLNLSTKSGSDKSGLRRFQEIPISDAVTALTRILDAHLSVVDAGFVAVDLYDGCFLYDFDTKSMCLIDLDEYRPGPFTLTEDRLPGSTRYMVPEEFVRGSMIDRRTTVFNLGRTLEILLDSSNGWRGSDEQARVAVRATAADPAERFDSVQQLVEDWIAACSTG